MPFFSIIIPTFNRAHIIRRPIDSIIAQTFTDWELIIVDDGSTDDTKSVVDSYQDSRIRYIWQGNQKESAARNQGIKLAKGEWICFQDSDDEYLTRHLMVLYKAIQNNANFKILKTCIFDYLDGHCVSVSGINLYHAYNSFPFDCFTTAAFHNTVLKEIQFENRYFINEDLHFLLKIGLSYEIHVIHDWTGIYYYDPKSSGGIGPHYEKKLINQKACLDDILIWNKTLIIPYIIRKRCLNEILMLFGHIKYKRRMISNAILDNVRIFYRFPKEYVKLVLRIISVKSVERSGLYKFKYRF